MQCTQLAAAVLAGPGDADPALPGQLAAEGRLQPGTPAGRHRTEATTAALPVQKGTDFLTPLINAFIDFRSGKIKSDTFHNEHSYKSLILFSGKKKGFLKDQKTRTQPQKGSTNNDVI